MTPELEQRVAADPVGVFAWVTRAGGPSACAVTPYVVAGHPVVTSTAALVAKAAAVRRDDRVALLAGGVAVVGTGVVGFDPSSRWFDDELRAAELAKYPPARSLLAVPGHRRLFPWYVARAVVRIEPTSVAAAPGSHRATVTVLGPDGCLHLAPLPPGADPPDRRIAVGDGTPDGRAVVLVHEEDAAMTDLRQRRLFGVVRRGTLTVGREDGSLTTTPARPLAQLRVLRDLAAKARGNRGRLATWPAPDRCDDPAHADGALAGAVAG